jgi:hypothetical protein
MDGMSWERWSRGFGVLFVVVVLIAFFTFGDQPKVDDSANDIVSFYDGDRGRILTGLAIFALSFVILAWFVGAIVNALRIAGEGRLAATAIVLTAVFIGVQFLSGTLIGGLATSIAGASADDANLLRALNTMAWSADALAAFPLAGAILAASVGLNRARVLPSWHVWLGFVAAILIVLRGTNWASDGFWAPSGEYTFISIIAALGWTLVTSVLLFRAPITEEAPPPRPATVAA